MLNQEVKKIHIKDLVLWTENPRDPISSDASDQDIIERALNGYSAKWSLEKLANEMGSHYDFSELPTVVYHENKPIVYDGNRRIVLGKIKHQIVNLPNTFNLSLPEFPMEIPCNVCSREIALQNVLRKHGDSGSWQPLERDIFLHKHMNKEKSIFLVIEESTGLISTNPHLNQRFVKDEIFREDVLKRLGFDIKNGILHTKHNDIQAKNILADISDKIKDKEISTRKNRGLVLETLEPTSQEIIDRNSSNLSRQFSQFDKNDNSKTTSDNNKNIQTSRQPRRTKKNEQALFGGKLYIKSGEVGNLYRDITDLYEFYLEYKDHPIPSKKLSTSFPSIIRMSLRLLCEAAAKDKKQGMDKFIQANFSDAKNFLDQNVKTTLANHNVTERSIVQLLHTGAHNYQAAANVEQTIALSIIIGAILTITHGQEETK